MGESTNTATTPIRVLVADDQEMVRSGLCAIIDRRPDLTVVGSVADGQAAVAASHSDQPDVVLMDVRMPTMDGVEATRRIRREWTGPAPTPRVLVLTTFDLDEYVYAALRAGASGFMLKNCSPTQLVEAIRTIATGDAMLAPSITRRLIQAFTEGAPPPVSPPSPGLADLTSREREVLVLVARGLSNAQIAAELGLTEANVKSRVNRVLTRLGLDNRVQAALLAYSNGLASP